MERKTIITTTVALFLLAASCGPKSAEQKSKAQLEQSALSAQDAPSALSAKDQVIVQLFGRLLLEDDPDPFQNLNGWTDGWVGYRPFFTSCWRDDDGSGNAAGRDKIFLCGGTTHEGGYSIEVLIDEEGNMKVDDESGDVVEYCIINRDTLLMFKNRRSGDVTNLLRKYDGNLHNLYIANFFNYLLAGKYSRKGSNQTIGFNATKSSVSGLFSAGETPFTFFEEYEDSPMPILCLSNGEAYKAARSIEGLILIPMRFPDEENFNMVEDQNKSTLFLSRIDESKLDLPPGVFPLASMQLMTSAECYLYAGGGIYANTLYHTNLEIMRNEILARYGYQFNDEMAGYFVDQEWYAPQSSDVSGKLTEIERINISIIRMLEEEIEHAWSDEPQDPIISQITDDILALPEMQFPRAAVMVEDHPSDSEPYYTIRGGSNGRDQFATSFWFHVYVDPVYEIKVYDVVSDRELSLEEWRKEKDK